MKLALTMALALILAVLVLVLRMLGRTLKRMPMGKHQMKSKWRPYSDDGPPWTRRRRRPPLRNQRSLAHLLVLDRRA